MALKVRLRDLEAWFHSLDLSKTVSGSQDKGAAAELPSVSTASFTPATTEQPVSQGSWVMVGRKCSLNQRPTVHLLPLHIGEFKAAGKKT